MRTILKSIKVLSILFIGMAMVNCEEDDVILPEVVAEFTYTINQETGVVSFINTSENANVFSWDFGDEESSTEVNPFHMYQPGTYLVVLSAKNVASPYVTFSDTIIIGETDPDPDPDPDPDTCTAETSENIDPANGDLNWTFMTNDTNHTFEAFGNTAGSIVDNPVIDDVNSSCYVEQFIKTSGCETWAGLGNEIATALDFTNASTNKVFTMKVLAETQVADVTLRLERLPFPNVDPAVERVGTITEVGAWQELTFDFSDVTTGTYKSIILYFERDTSCDGDIYYFDDLQQVAGSGSGGGGGGGTTFDDGLLTNGDFENGADSWIGNAVDVQTEGGNSFNFANVGAAGNPWDVNLSQVVEIEQGATYTLSFKASTGAGTTRTILAGIGLNEAPWTNVTETVTLTDQLQDFEYTFTATDFGIPNSRVLFDMGADTGVVVIDNVALFCNDCGGSGGGGGGGGSGTYTLDDTIDFESAGYGAAWGWNVFENDTNPPLEFIANPVSGGINTSATVAKITALQSGQPWAGTETQHGEMGITWDLDASNAIIKIMVYKTVISDVGIKLVNPTGGAQEEIKVPNTVVNQWEELTFDFSSRIGNGLDGSTNIDQIVVFPDFNLGGRTSDNVVYFDNIRFTGN